MCIILFIKKLNKQDISKSSKTTEILNKLKILKITSRIKIMQYGYTILDYLSNLSIL